jgi:hypothetical protein
LGRETRRACVEAKDYGRAGAARQRAGDTARADMRQPTQVRVADGVPATSGGRHATLAGVAHGSGRPGGLGAAHTGAHGAMLSHGRRWRPARRASGLLGAHDEMATTRGLVRATWSDIVEGWELLGAWAQVATTRG